MTDWQGFSKCLKRSYHKQKEHNMRLHVKCACAIGGTRDLWLPQNGVVLQFRRMVASQNCCSCQFADKRAQRLYCGESGVVLCLNELKDSFRWWAMLDYEKEEEEEEEEERRKKMTKSEFYSDLSLDSRVLSGTFKSVFVNC